MNPNTILWIYIVLLVIGGLMGFIKAKSKASLIASVSFAAVLILCQVGVVNPKASDVILAVLLVFFGVRYAKGKKFMPAGFMVILTLVTLALRHI
ncbi:MAG: TMEM14 family protein [Verrucomicrobiota bacterium]